MCFSGPMESELENLSLLEEEEDELVLDPQPILQEGGDSDLCVVGRVVSDQPIIFNLLRTRMALIWKPTKGVHVKEIGDSRFLFQFFRHIDVKRVMDGAPWSFGPHPLVLHRLRLGDIPQTVPLTHIPFWVHIHGLPVGFFSENIGKSLGDFLGRFLEYDESNRASVWREFMRIRVELDVNEPLKRFKKLKFNGKLISVSFKYERLQAFCFLCGKLGHTESFCNILYDLDEAQIEVIRKGAKGWGPFLKADVRKSIRTMGDRWLRAGDGRGFGQAKDPVGKGADMEDRGGVNSPKGNLGGSPVKNPNANFLEESSKVQISSRGFCNDLSMVSNPIYEDSPRNKAEDLHGNNFFVETKKRKVTSQFGNEDWQAGEGAKGRIDNDEGSDNFLGVGPAERAHPS